MRILLTTSAVTLALTALVSAQVARLDRAGLIANVGEIGAPGVPGPLLITSDTAFPVVDAGVSKGVKAPVVAAGTLGDGRFVAFGHTGYVTGGAARESDTWPLIVAGVRWTAPPSVADDSIRIGATDAALVKHFRSRYFNCAHLKGRSWTDQLGSFDVIVCGSHALRDDQIEAVRQFVATGHGLLVGGLAWGWLQLNPGRALGEHPGNRLLGPAGVFWADGYLQRTSDEGYAVAPELSPMLHARTALLALDDELDDAQRAQAAWTATQAARMLPESDRTLRPLIDDLVDRHRAAIVPAKSAPLRATQALERLLLTVELERAAKAPVDAVAAHPAAEVFPGAVPEAPPVQRVIEIDPGRPGWHGTGVYAPPAAVITVTVPTEAARAGWHVRLGCHTDTLYHKDRWDRAPEITRVEPIVGETTPIAGAFGGLVYIEVPSGGADERPVEVTVRGGVAAPRFVLGATSVDAWRAEIRTAPGPWAELETSKVILTVPSSEIRTLDDPVALLEFWNHVLDAAATLAARPLDRDRPERYVADVQISAGYMHAGYPIMTHLDAAARMVDVNSLRRGAWGLYHELGHNHQSRDWTFAGTGEVTCNLFSLYIIDTLCEVPAGERGHTGATGDVGMAAYFANGSDFEHWKRKPFLALRMYIQLQDAFGWEPFQRVFAVYRDLPEAQRPKKDAEKRDQWMVRMSRAVGRNLGPFFQRWGVPTSAEARKAIEDLPGWMPEALRD